MNGGYVMLDLSSLNWADGDDQDLPGIYERAAEVMNSGSLILVGVDSGGVVPGYIRKVGTTYQVCGYITAPYTADIKPQDKVQINVE